MKQTNTPQDMAQANQPTLEIHKAVDFDLDPTQGKWVVVCRETFAILHTDTKREAQILVENWEVADWGDWEPAERAVHPSEVRAGDVITLETEEYEVTRDAWQEFEDGAWYVTLVTASPPWLNLWIGSVRLDMDEVIVRR